LQDRGDIGVGVAGMNDDWEPALPGGRDVGAETRAAMSRGVLS